MPNETLSIQKLRGDAIVAAMAAVDAQIGGSAMRTNNSGRVMAAGNHTPTLNRSQILATLGLSEEALQGAIDAARGTDATLTTNAANEIPPTPGIMINRTSAEIVAEEKAYKRNCDDEFAANEYNRIVFENHFASNVVDPTPAIMLAPRAR